MVHYLKYLSNYKKSLILNLFRKNGEIFDSILGNYTGSEYKIKLLKGTKTVSYQTISYFQNT